MQHWRKTGNSNVAIQTGSTYISDSMTDITAIPMANLKKLTPGDCNDDRQPEMAMWPPKPEILIPLELWQIEWQFQRQIWGFRPRLALKNWPRAIATTTDNRKQQHTRFGRQYCNFWYSIIVAIIYLIFYPARHHQKSRIWRLNFEATCQRSRDVIISGFGGHIDISGCRSLLYLLTNIILHIYITLYPRFVVGILTVPFIA